MNRFQAMFYGIGLQFKGNDSLNCGNQESSFEQQGELYGTEKGFSN